MIKNTLPDKSRIPESLKNNRNSSKAFQLIFHSWWGFAEGVLQVVLFTILLFKWSVKKHCVAKVLLAIWEIFLHENNCNYNSYRFSYKFSFILFYFLSYKPKSRTRSSASWWSGNEKYLCFLITANRALL